MVWDNDHVPFLSTMSCPLLTNVSDDGEVPAQRLWCVEREDHAPTDLIRSPPKSCIARSGEPFGGAFHTEDVLNALEAHVRREGGTSTRRHALSHCFCIEVISVVAQRSVREVHCISCRVVEVRSKNPNPDHTVYVSLYYYLSGRPSCHWLRRLKRARRVS